MQNLLLQLFSVIRLHLSADLQHNPESHHPVRGEFCGIPYTCFRTKFTPYQFEPNLEDFANVILDMIDIVLVSMSAKYGLQTRPIFTWMVLITDTIGDIGVSETHTYLRHDHCIHHKLPFGLHSPAKGSLGPFSCTKR